MSLTNSLQVTTFRQRIKKVNVWINVTVVCIHASVAHTLQETRKLSRLSDNGSIILSMLLAYRMKGKKQLTKRTEQNPPAVYRLFHKVPQSRLMHIKCSYKNPQHLSLLPFCCLNDLNSDFPIADWRSDLWPRPWLKKTAPPVGGGLSITLHVR